MADAPDLPQGYTLDQSGEVPVALPPGYALDTGPKGTLQSGPALVGTGVYQGLLRDPLNSGAVLLAKGLSALAPQGSSLEKWANDQLSSIEQANATNESAYSKLVGSNPGATAGRTVGNIGATLPFAAVMPGGAATSLTGRLLQGAGLGAATGALQPTQPDGNYWGEVGRNILMGGAAGAGAPAVMSSAASAIAPSASSRLAPLLKAGITPTIGQAAGGAINRLEQAATSIPLLGDFVKSARARVGDQFYRAAVNEGLLPIGQQLDNATASGRDAFTEMRGKIQNNYNTLLPNVTATIDPTFAANIQKLVGLSKFLPGGRPAQFQNFLSNEVLNKFNAQTGNMTGETFKDVESVLGQEANDYIRAPHPDDRKYGRAVLQLQAEMRDMLARNNPDQAAALSANNDAWSRMLRVQRASSYTGADEGVFSPAQLQRAVRAMTPESVYAQGKGVMQPLADTGKSVLGSTVPDSGTPFRSLATILGGAALGHGMSPEIAAGAAAGGIGAAGIYSPLGQWLLTHGLVSRPPGSQSVAAMLRGLSPYASVGAASTTAP